MDEKDPHGLDPRAPGAKLDAGKPKYMLVLQSFPDALAAVNAVGEYGVEKYSLDGWRKVSDGIARYSEAMVRHMIPRDLKDAASGLEHDAQAAWNALARLQLRIEAERKTKRDDVIPTPKRPEVHQPVPPVVVKSCSTCQFEKEVPQNLSCYTCGISYRNWKIKGTLVPR